MSQITRVHLGASRLEDLPPSVLKFYLNKSWLHLGDPTPETLSSIQRMRAAFANRSLTFIARRLIEGLFLSNSRRQDGISAEQIYSHTNFEPFYFSKGDRLPLSDGSISYVYSEHMFEHLFLDDAIALLQECHRLLKPKGVVRIVVPDADLRTYERIEPVGYPDRKTAWNTPEKHKTRWSVYSLSEAVRVAGLTAVPLVYCDKHGVFHKRRPTMELEKYQPCPDDEMIMNLDHVFRQNSLIVDGIKP